MRRASYQAVLFLLSFFVVPLAAQDFPSFGVQPNTSDAAVTPHAAPGAAPGSFDELVDRAVEREHQLLTQLRNLRPMVETYLQELKPDANGTGYPINDQYFLGRLEMGESPEDVSFMHKAGFARSGLSKLTGIYSLHFQPLGFAQMVVLDTDFEKKNYTFTFVRREFLGEVRCAVIDVQPRPEASPGRFAGRIWVEDQDYNIVRFNGTYSHPAKNSLYLHFDSWRLNLKPGVWLPAYVYSEESDLETRSGRARVKAQTRLWGYDLNAPGKSGNDEFTQVLIEAQPGIGTGLGVKDSTNPSADPTPIIAERMWERLAEDNAIERLQKVGLLAPPGEVDKVLQTVADNLLVSNNIDVQSEVRCRVLITAPLESFTIGHTIVVSRGLLDVLPDEASLAMVLAHELSHIVLGHQFDPKLAFNDRLFFPDEQSFQRMDFKRRVADEESADAKALDLLKNSPYKDKLGSAGLFLRALQHRAPELPNLIRPHLGNGLAVGEGLRMSALMTSAPQLDEQRVDQIAALPLGGRIKLDPWSDHIELAHIQPVTLALAKEKRPFEISPFFPYLTRLTGAQADKVTVAGSGSK